MNKFNLGFFPTPLHELKNLSEKYSGYKIYIKRDDCTGLASGGNKTRKLEYLIRDAMDKGSDTVITAGAQQSNHCRQTAAACSRAKLKCHLLLGGNEPEHYNGNLLLSKILGATIHFTGDNRKGEDIEILAKDLKSRGLIPYVIPYGGSNIIGAHGFIEGVKELQEQLGARKLNIDYIFFASSSGGTHAGLALGKHIYNLEAKLMPVSIDKDEAYGQKLDNAVLNLVNQGKAFYNIGKSFTIEDFKLIEEYSEAGYGVITNNEKDAITELAEKEGILVDPVYTGRAFYGMLDHLRRKLLKPESNVLFWHTGGLPATFYYGDQLK
jgi:D-cysteine desulfhydrase family pyridoxal phosphate-dependent enzyme